ALKGERKKVTIMFTDIREFTPLAESLPPEEVVTILNQYLTSMTSIIFKYEGTIDKFLGDGLMAIFGAPISHPDDVLRATKSAVEIQNSLRLENIKREKANLRPIYVGIGINVGEAVVGNIGSRERLDYTVIGDSVNLASRLQEYARGGEVVVSEMVYQELTRAGKTLLPFRFSESMPVQVKGKTEAINIYKLIF
ncbi:MAG: adenylate/guanylate cyclase domain-containing protein, partial [candidate division WOR-3 bacterium]